MPETEEQKSPSTVAERIGNLDFTPEQYKRLKWKAQNNRRRGYKRNSKPYLFYKRHDWKALREEFFSELNLYGTYFYPTVNAFIRAKLAKTT